MHDIAFNIMGVGYIVGSWHHSDSCRKEQQQYCEDVIWMYGSNDVDGSVTIDQEVRILRGSAKQQAELFRIYSSNKEYNVWFQFLL